MPSRHTSRGLRPAISLSPNRMAPESGASWPLIMLKQVDLPAPFGPIMARNSPRPISNETSLTARTPPKALDTERTESTVITFSSPSNVLVLPNRRAKAPAMPPGNTSTSSRMMRPSSARQYSVCRMTVSCSSANTVAPTIGPLSVWMPPSSTITRPSIERPTCTVSGEIEPLAKANSPPAIAADAAGDREGEPVHALDVDADRLGAQRRIAPGPHGVAERREQQAPQPQHRRHGEREREQEIDRSAVERRRRPDADHAVGAAGQCLPLEHGRPDDLRERERQHGEIDAGEPHREPAEQQRAQERDDGRGDERKPHRHGEPFHQQRRAIGAEAEIGGVAERMHAARAGDEMQRGGEDHRDQHVDAEDQQDRASLAPAAAATTAAPARRRRAPSAAASPAGSDIPARRPSAPRPARGRAGRRAARSAPPPSPGIRRPA